MLCMFGRLDVCRSRFVKISLCQSRHRLGEGSLMVVVSSSVGSTSSSLANIPCDCNCLLLRNSFSESGWTARQKVVVRACIV